jgi:hypothetical protein
MQESGDNWAEPWINIANKVYWAAVNLGQEQLGRERTRKGVPPQPGQWAGGRNTNLIGEDRSTSEKSAEVSRVYKGRNNYKLT